MKKALSVFFAVLFTISCFSVISAAAAAPAAPVLTGVRNVGSGCIVSWKPVKKATPYVVYRKSGSSGWARIKVLENSSSSSYKDTTVKSGTKYTYTVRYYVGKSFSAYNKTGVSSVFLSAPKLLSAANVTNGMKVTWSKVPGATSYKVYRKATSGWSRIATLGAVLTYTDTAAPAGAKCTYTVIACRGTSYSAYYTAGITALRLINPVYSTLSKSSTSNTVAWKAVKSATSYTVYRRTIASSWSVLDETTALKYVDNAIEPGVMYSYAVRASNGSVRSSYSTCTPWDLTTTNGIFNFYKTAVNAVKTDGLAGYTLKYTTAGSDFKVTGNGPATELLGPIMEDNINDSGSFTLTKTDEYAAENFPPCTLTDMSKIKSATVADKGSYYQFVFVFVDEKAPTRDAGFLWNVTDSVIYPDEYKAELVSSGAESGITVNKANINYPGFRIVANIAKGGEIKGLSQTGTANLSMTMTMNGITLPMTGKITDKVSYSAFTY